MNSYKKIKSIKINTILDLIIEIHLKVKLLNNNLIKNINF